MGVICVVSRISRSFCARNSWPWVCLAFLVVAALALRVRQLAPQCASRDECFSWRLIQYPLRNQISRTAADVHPPFYYVLLTCWSVCWGSSMLALRMLSVALGTGTVAIMYSTARRSLDSIPGASQRIAGGLFCAALMAVHVVHLDADRIARMYSLGVLLAILSSWLLLKAIDSPTSELRWWALYGLATSAFCYTHYYAFLTVFAQGAFVVALLAWGALSRDRAKLKRYSTGLGVAVLVAAATYLPWVSALLHQVEEVREGYWIPKVGWNELKDDFYWWSTGTKATTSIEWWVWMAVLGGIGIAALCRTRAAALFWLFQAAIPWLTAVGISYGERPVFQVRYMAFAHVGLVACLGVGVVSMPTLPGKLLAGWFVMTTCMLGTWERVADTATQRPAIAEAMRFVQAHHQDGDTILVSWHGEVNRVRYYAGEAGISSADVRCISDGWSGPGHMVHVASLNEQDVIRPSQIDAEGRRWWQVDDTGGWAVPLGTKPLLERTFEGPGDYTHYSVRLFSNDGLRDSGE